MKTSPSIHPNPSSLSPKRLQNADELIARYVERGILPGAVTLVARHGKSAHLKTHGWSDIEKRVPMQENSLFRIYSMTKIVTTVAVLMLYEKGLLDLNDAVPKSLPGFANRQVRQADGTLVPLKETSYLWKAGTASKLAAIRGGAQRGSDTFGLSGRVRPVAAHA